MKKFIIYFIVSSFAFCKGAEKKAEPATPSNDPDTILQLPDSIVMKGTHLGKDIANVQGAIPAHTIYKLMAEKDSMPLKIVGEIDEVCQEKGCWLTVKVDEGKTFRGYTGGEFYFDTKISGRKVLLDGYAKWDVTTEDELKEFAKDERKSAAEIAKIKGDKKELSYYISGAVVL